MALDLESRLRVFLASAPQNVRSIGVFEIAHSLMSQTWYLWREPTSGQVTTEDYDLVTVLPANITAELAGSPANLDQIYKIALGTVDIEDLFREELDRIPLDTTERVQLVYREYLSDDLTEPQAVVHLQVESLVCERGTVGIMAASPRFNVQRTGRVYSPRDIPMLRGFT
jgi:hypothetical protein